MDDNHYHQLRQKYQAASLRAFNNYAIIEITAKSKRNDTNDNYYHYNQNIEQFTDTEEFNENEKQETIIITYDETSQPDNGYYHFNNNDDIEISDLHYMESEDVDNDNDEVQFIKTKHSDKSLSSSTSSSDTEQPTLAVIIVNDDDEGDAASVGGDVGDDDNDNSGSTLMDPQRDRINSMFKLMNDLAEEPWKMISAVYHAERQNNGDHFLNMGVEVEQEVEIVPDSTIKFTFEC